MFESNRGAILAFGAIQIVHLLQGLTQTLMREPFQALLIAHLIDSKAASQIFTCNGEFAQRLVIPPDLHIFPGKASGIATNALQSLQSTLVKAHGFLWLTKPEIVVGQIIKNLQGKYRVENLPMLNGTIAALVVLRGKGVVIEKEVRPAQQIAGTFNILHII